MEQFFRKLAKIYKTAPPAPFSGALHPKICNSTPPLRPKPCNSNPLGKCTGGRKVVKITLVKGQYASSGISFDRYSKSVVTTLSCLN